MLSTYVRASAQNSAFRNPIITGFHPDLSCIFVPKFNDTWSCTSSSFLAFPGLLIHATALTKATSGIYAPTLRFREGIFYLTTTLVNQQLPRISDSRWDNFLVTTEDPYSSEAWSDPVHFSFPGSDPSPFWDEDGTTYDTGEIGNIIMPWNGTGRSSPEGPHIFKRDGWYYLLAAEGGTRENHMVTMARSRSLQGPFEPAAANPLLTAANNTSSYFQAVGHADLFQDANGKWWGVALAVRAGGSYGESPYFANFPLGRETVLTPVTWEEGGWPVFTPSIPEQGEGQLNDADDNVAFPPGSRLPIHFTHWGLPTARNYAVSPPGHWKLEYAGIKILGAQPDGVRRGLRARPWTDRQTFVGCRMAHSLFRFRVNVDWASSLIKEDMGSSQDNYTRSAPLQPYIRFRGHSETPYRGRSSAPSEAYPLPEDWAGKKLTLQIETTNLGEEAGIQVFGHCRGDELVPY
ncbi:beta-xylosidase [Daldinia sp. FL1419]|nr:beta-xylosidase [Daldinia sp. FL1419]